MIFDFEFFLTLAMLITGLIALLDKCVFAPQRKKQGIEKCSTVVEYARSFFPILLFVWLLRSFLLEPYRIPSGSDKPTLLVGDFLVVNKFSYGLRLPVLYTKLVKIDEPKRGDIVVFRWPIDSSKDFIKRVIGVPGDRISYVNKVLYVNGQEAPQMLIGDAQDKNEVGETWPVIVKEEDFVGIKHKIYLRPDVPAQDFSVIVPQGEYFVMGDNRDDSNDSRYWCNERGDLPACVQENNSDHYWGFVPEGNLKGKAFLIWFSWDSDYDRVRWDRIGELIH